MAGSGHVQNGKVRLAIAQGIQHRGDQIPGVQRPGFTRFQIHLHTVFGLHFRDALFQRGKVVTGAGDVVPAAEVEPLHPGQQVPELLLHRRQCRGQCVRILLTQGVEVQPIQQLWQGRVCLHGGVPLGTGGAQTAAGGAGVVDFVAFLRGALRVDAQTNAFARCLCRRAELCQLAGRVEHDMVSVLQ